MMQEVLRLAHLAVARLGVHRSLVCRYTSPEIRVSRQKSNLDTTN